MFLLNLYFLSFIGSYIHDDLPATIIKADFDSLPLYESIRTHFS